MAASLDVAYYAPDRGTPYRWFEGAQDIQTFFTDDYRAAGYLYAYVRNDGDAAVDAVEFLLDGRPLEALRTEHRVVWWRLLPRPLLPGREGEIMVRLRYPLEEPCDLRVRFSDGSTVAASISPRPNPLRIETVGFGPDGAPPFLVVESLDSKPRQVSRVLMAGQDVTDRCHIMAPGFIHGLCPIAIRADSRPPLGEYIRFMVQATDGEQASCVLKVLDGWVPLGSYGYGMYEEYARNGCNGHANFGRASRSDLDAHARLSMRQLSMLGSGEVLDYEVGHPGLYAHYLHDEPDCSDYNYTEIPAPLRIGQMAMEIEERAQKVRVANPTRPSLLTVDLTFKPANYYIYGPIADITNPDCYPLSLGADATMVREVVETARLGAGPRPLTFTFQGVLEGPRDPEAFAKLRFPRPAFPAEERIMMYYAIGAGARGLFNYIHCTENSDTRWSRGSGEFPEIWNEIGVVYRELEHVSPLLALAHPTQLATCSEPKLWLRTLLCGENAVVVIYVNDTYEQKRDSFRYQPLREVRINLEALPWMPHFQAFTVGEHGFDPLEVAGLEIRVPRIDVAGAILLTADPQLPDVLRARYHRRQSEVGAGLLAQWRWNQAATARERTAFRLIMGEFADRAVAGRGTGAYGMHLDGYWNPLDEPHNVLEFGVNEREEGPQQGVSWTFTIPPQQAGQPHVLFACLGTWGQPGEVRITSENGETVVQTQVEGNWGGKLRMIPFTPPAVGNYTATFRVPGPGPKGGRAGHVAYVVPGGELFDEVRVQ